MNRIISFFLIVLFSLFNSCQPETIEDARSLSIEKDFEVITKNNYKISVLNYMLPSTTLNKEASLQYMATLKKEYIIVIDEYKDLLIDALNEYNDDSLCQKDLISYRDAQFQYTEQMMEIKSQSRFSNLTINGLAAETIEIEAKLKELEEPVSYFFYYIDGIEHFYTIMAWTLSSKKDIYREKVKKMIKTFNTL